MNTAPSSSTHLVEKDETRISEMSYMIRSDIPESCETMTLSSEMTEPSPQFSGTPSTTNTDVSIDVAEGLPEESEARELIDAYYKFFHSAHPFAPEKTYLLRMHSIDAATRPLYLAICYVGSLHHQSPPRGDLKQLALQYTQVNQTSQCDVDPKGIYQVSAMLLLAIATHGQTEMSEANDLLQKAISFSSQLGMNRVGFLDTLSDTELSELCKRTYWYLYIVASALTGDDCEVVFEPAPAFPLPCARGASEKVTLLQFDTADFEDHSYSFSSLTYLIALVRVGRSIRGLCERSKGQPDRTIVRADALLMNWKLHLPPDKQHVFTRNGEIDDVMFQSHILFHSLCIYVHTTLSSKVGSTDDVLHRRRKLEAAEGAVSLLTLHPHLLQMSPLNISSLSGIAMSNLCTSLLYESDVYTRDNTRLILGVLKQLGEVWTAAKQEARALKSMARLSYSEPRNSAQDANVSTQTSPTNILFSDSSSLYSEIAPLVPHDELETTPYDSSSSLTVPISESFIDSPGDAYLLSWDL
ncbi:hypothetical protein F4802DRAFT_369003 [Xylaria palmicola]|nr:hypothetical protein F4802DRAFT_369003 [Xylaria palmicola]